MDAMLLGIITEVSEMDKVYYKAALDDFEPIYEHLHNAEYVKAKVLALEQMQAGCLDVRYAMYAAFGLWYESEDFDNSAWLLGELISIHKYYDQKSNEKMLHKKQYIATVIWLHERMYEHVLFVKDVSKVAFTGDKARVQNAFGDYIRFFEKFLTEIELSKIFQTQKVWNSLLAKAAATSSIEETEEVNTGLSPEKQAVAHHISGNFSMPQGNDKWSILLKNIAIYTDLVQQESWLKAAIVHKVISEEIQKFNPIDYFPDTFYPYLHATANAFNPLMKKEQLSGEPLWPILEQMFESCPDSFARSDALNNSESLFVRADHAIQDMPRNNYLADANDYGERSQFEQDHKEKADSSW